MIQVWLAFLAGLAGSVHCIGMCGGVVAALSLTGRCRSLTTRITSQLFYNIGRITTYALLGAVAGWAGSSLDLPTMKAFGRWFLVGANLFIILIGIGSALKLGWFSISTLEGSAGQFLAKPLRRLLTGTSPLSALPLGMLLGLLPCGLVYTPLMVAMGSGSPLQGAAIMAALGAGTLPLLMLFGTASSAITGAVREIMFRLVGVIIALMGIAGLWRLLMQVGHHH